MSEVDNFALRQAPPAATRFNRKFISEDQKIKIMSLSGVKQYPMRVKCATLSWHTLVSAMDKKKDDVNTEASD